MIKRCNRDKNGRFARHEWGEWNKDGNMAESCLCIRCSQKAIRSAIDGLLSKVYLPTMARMAFEASVLCDVADIMMGKRRMA